MDEKQSNVSFRGMIYNNRGFLFNIFLRTNKVTNQEFLRNIERSKSAENLDFFKDPKSLKLGFLKIIFSRRPKKLKVQRIFFSRTRRASFLDWIKKYLFRIRLALRTRVSR